MNLKKVFFILGMASFSCLGAPAANQGNNPYGVCAHVTRGEDYGSECPLMVRAGIGWVRSDFDLCAVEGKQGVWTFENYDRVIAGCEAHGMQLLPILGNPPAFANPAHQHLDQWEEMVRKSVERYQGRLPVWEVWNEENISGFWKNPNATNYCELLRRTYKTVKSVNPKLLVAFGGLAGTPIDFVEEVYKTGGKDGFDIMNIHPYSQPSEPESSLERRIGEVRGVMAKYGDAAKPMWITEIGWPTPDVVRPMGGFYKAALAAAMPEKKNWHVGFLQDGRLLRGYLPDAEIDECEWPAGSTLERLTVPALLSAMASKRLDAILLSVGEAFPADLFDALFAFVKEGGVWIQPGGMPVWTGLTRNPQTDKWEEDKKVNCSALRERLRVQTEAWWTNKKIPHRLNVEPTAAGKGIRLQKEEQAERFFLPGALKPGDAFIPLLTGTNEGYTATAAAVYKYNSDLKGAFVTCGFFNLSSGANTEEKQGRMVPRAALIAFQSGIERFFWYEFQAPEQDNFDGESHFGMTHRDYQPKPAYAAYWTLISKRPAGSTKLDLPWKMEREGLYFPQWKRPDGRVAGAVWSFFNPGTYTLTFDAKNVSLSTHTGRHLNPKWNEGASVDLRLSGAPVYFTGAKLVSVRLKE